VQHTEVELSGSIALDSDFGELVLRHIKCGENEGVAITPPQNGSRTPVLVRLQSSCLFSESFGCADCDCALQLHESLRIICSEGGVLLYFYEEGRGAGLRAKVDAIRIQQSTGCDTAAAYRQLHLSPDPREYKVAALVLTTMLGAGTPIELLTNNPQREMRLRQHGINVAVRRSLILPVSARVISYLNERARVLGHIIPG
jgi:GTP cyclohydrolase II